MSKLRSRAWVVVVLVMVILSASGCHPIAIAEDWGEGYDVSLAFSSGEEKDFPTAQKWIIWTDGSVEVIADDGVEIEYPPGQVLSVKVTKVYTPKQPVITTGGEER